METNFKGTRDERDERVASEKHILEELNTDARKIEDAIALEAQERSD
jgi:hypothetical protein